MRPSGIACALLLCAACGGSDSSPTSPSPANVAGTWSVSVVGSGGAVLSSGTMSLQQNVTAVTGTASPSPAPPRTAIFISIFGDTVTGTVSGNSVSLTEKFSGIGSLPECGASGTAHYTLTLNGNTMSGPIDVTIAFTTNAVPNNCVAQIVSQGTATFTRQ